MSVPSINSVLDLQRAAQSLSIQLDELLRPDGEAENLAELRAAGVSERRMLTLYPFRHDVYADEIKTLLDRPASWFSRMLAGLRRSMRSLMLPEVIWRELDRRTSPTIWQKGLRFSSSSIFTSSSRDDLAYMVATVHVLTQMDLTPFASVEVAPFFLTAQPSPRPWWKYVGEDLGQISQLLFLTRFMLFDFEQAKSNRQTYALYDPLRLLSHEPKNSSSQNSLKFVPNEFRLLQCGPWIRYNSQVLCCTNGEHRVSGSGSS